MFDISSTCGGVLLNGVGQTETNEEHEEVFVEEGFQLARIVMGNRSINIEDGSELELA